MRFIKPLGADVVIADLQDDMFPPAFSYHLQTGIEQTASDAAALIMRMNANISQNPRLGHRPASRIDGNIADQLLIPYIDIAQTDAQRQIVQPRNQIKTIAHVAQIAHFAYGRTSALIHRIGKDKLNQIGQRPQIRSQINRPQPIRAQRRGRQRTCA